MRLVLFYRGRRLSPSAEVTETSHFNGASSKGADSLNKGLNSWH